MLPSAMVENLRQNEESAKLKTRSQIFDKIENDRYFAERCMERNNPKLMEGRTQISIIPKIKKDVLMDRAKIYQELEIWTATMTTKVARNKLMWKMTLKQESILQERYQNQSIEWKIRTSWNSTHMQHHMCLGRWAIMNKYDLLINIIQRQATP